MSDPLAQTAVLAAMLMCVRARRAVHQHPVHQPDFNISKDRDLLGITTTLVACVADGGGGRPPAGVERTSLDLWLVHPEHYLICLSFVLVSQMAAEGGVPAGVGRNSLDSAFGSAQRALQLSTLSMPERIAYMQVSGCCGRTIFSGQAAFFGLGPSRPVVAPVALVRCEQPSRLSGIFAKGLGDVRSCGHVRL